MSKWKVVLWMSFGAVWASVDEVYGGDIRYFDTLEEAQNYGRSKGVVYETVEVKE